MRNSLTLLKEKSFYSQVFHIALPISFQILIQSILGLVDQIMVGQLGEEAIAAVGLGNRPGFIFLFVMGGIAGAAGIFFSQYFGKGDQENFSKPATASFFAGLVATSLFLLGCLLFSVPVLRIFSEDTQVIDQGALYLRIASYSFPALGATALWTSALRSSGITRFPMYTGIGAVAVNSLLNYLLIFGHLGFPEMGVAGAAWATVIARTLEGVVILGVVYSKKWPGNFSFPQLWDWDPVFLKKFGLTAWPLMATEFFWVMGDTAFAAVYGRLGTKSLAAITMTFPLQSLTIGFFVGFSNAAAILLGQRLGKNQLEEAVTWGGAILALSAMASASIGVVLVGVSRYYLGLFSVEPQVLNVTAALIIAFSFYLPVKVYNMVAGNGVLRSGGDTGYVFVADIIGMWGFGIPLALFSAFVLKWPILGVYLLLSSEEILRAVLMTWRIVSRKWAVNLVADPVGSL